MTGTRTDRANALDFNHDPPGLESLAPGDAPERTAVSSDPPRRHASAAN
jgi:hypothetical protein